MAGMIQTDYNGINILSFPEFNALGWVAHGFTTRLGGVSKAEFRTLNMGLHVGDSHAAVLENRRLALGALGFDYKVAVAGEQIHGIWIAYVTENEVSRGAEDMSTALPGTDALVTDKHGIVLTSYYADCVPVFLVDPENHAVGLVHSGWKGTLAKISSETVSYMMKTFGTRPDRLLVGVGPHIGTCCYEIDTRLAERFQAVFGSDPQLVNERETGYYLNLSWAVTAQLIESGCSIEKIYNAGLCTSCNTELFFSHRAEKGHTGRSASIICITG